MAFDISVEHDLKRLKKSLSALESKTVSNATVRTINRVAESARTASTKHIAKAINSRQAAVKRRIESRKATYKKLWAELVAKHKNIQLIEFVIGSKKSTQQKGGKRPLVKVKVNGRKRTLKKSFIAPRRKGSSKTTIYMRKKKTRLPVKMLYGPSIMQLFKQGENVQLMRQIVQERLASEFARNVSFYLSKLKR